MNILISEADGESTSRDSSCSRCHCYFGDSRRRGDGGSAGSGHHVDGVGGYHRRDAGPMARPRWGAGLATGPIIGGQFTAPRYYEPFPGFLDDYPPRYGGPSDMAVLTGRLIAFHAIGHSIRSAERIEVATAGDTIASNRRH